MSSPPFCFLQSLFISVCRRERYVCRKTHKHIISAHLHVYAKTPTVFGNSQACSMQSRGEQRQDSFIGIMLKCIKMTWLKCIADTVNLSPVQRKESNSAGNCVCMPSPFMRLINTVNSSTRKDSWLVWDNIAASTSAQETNAWLRVNWNQGSKHITLLLTFLLPYSH